MMSEEEKYAHIDKISNFNTLDYYTYQILDELSRDKDDEIRMRIAELLINFHSDYSDKILLRLANDDSELVRVSSCDSMRSSSSRRVIEELRRHAREESVLVRGYSIMSLCEVIHGNHQEEQNEYILFFKKLLDNERDDWVKVHLYFALVRFGDYCYFECLAKGLKNRNYRVRYVTVKLLVQLTNITNRVKIGDLLKIQYRIEKAESVKEVLKAGIDELEE